MKNVLRIVLAAGSMLAAAAANAATATTTFQVTAAVNSACQTNATNMAFTPYTPGAGLVNQVSTVNVRCTLGTTYNVGLNAGTFGATVTTRQMGTGALRLNYSLFRDAARTLNWGTTVGTDTVVGTGAGIAAAFQALTVYGQIPDSAANQAATPSTTYTDTITVTVTY